MSETAIFLRIAGRTTRIDGASAVIGRSRNCEVKLDAAVVSRRHCEIILRPDGAFIRDLGSMRGTYLDGRRLTGEERLSSGSRVTLGESGPAIELASAILDGRPTPMGRAAPRTDAAPALMPPPSTEAPTVAISGPVAVPEPPRAPRPVAAIAWGALAGFGIGLLVLALLPRA